MPQHCRFGSGPLALQYTYRLSAFAYLSLDLCCSAGPTVQGACSFLVPEQEIDLVDPWSGPSKQAVSPGRVRIAEGCSAEVLAWTLGGRWIRA
jgi:hypothetical protein